ncbi:MAG: DUF6580 family putative transport protein [Pirellulales bacterium]
MSKQWLSAVGMFSLLVGLCVAGRLLPHWPNFTPVAAVALFAGYWYRRRAVALAVPLVALLLSDAIIGLYDVRTMVVVYAALAMGVYLRPLLGGRRLILRAAGCSVLCSLAFFLATNGAVWMFGSMYPHTAGGLAACYLAGLPFFKYTLYGNAVWTGVLFGTYAAATQRTSATAWRSRPVGTEKQCSGSHASPRPRARRRYSKPSRSA